MLTDEINARLRDPERPFLIIGLTGSIGSGKSAVAEIFARRGAAIIDADLLARTVAAPGTPGLSEIAARYGAAVLLPDGSLNRRALGEIVFRNPGERQWLERCLHPRIREEYNRALTKAVAAAPSSRGTGRHLIVYVVPLLFEATTPPPFLDYVVVAAASPERSIERIVQRDQCSPELAQKKLLSQLPIEEKASRADIVIRNDGTREELAQAAEAVFSRLAALPPKSPPSGI